MKNKEYKHSKYWVALKIVFDEIRARKSFKPLKLLWKKVYYGDVQPYRIKTTLVEYVNFCRVNKIAMVIPEEELA